MDRNLVIRLNLLLNTLNHEYSKSPYFLYELWMHIGHTKYDESTHEREYIFDEWMALTPGLSGGERFACADKSLSEACNKLLELLYQKGIIPPAQSLITISNTEDIVRLIKKYQRYIKVSDEFKFSLSYRPGLKNEPWVAHLYEGFRWPTSYEIRKSGLTLFQALRLMDEQYESEGRALLRKK